MLIRLITVISLIQFILMMISGMNINVALYRSILVFMILFTVVYLSVFFLNIIQDKNAKSEGSAVAQGNNPQNSKEN